MVDGLRLGVIICECVCRSDGELLSGDCNFLAIPVHHTEGLSKRGYRQNSSSIGDIQICRDVDGHHNFHPDCDVHLISKSCAFLTILPPPCLGFGCDREFLF